MKASPFMRSALADNIAEVTSTFVSEYESHRPRNQARPEGRQEQLMYAPIFKVCSQDPGVVALLGAKPTRLYLFAEAPDQPGRPYATWQTFGGEPENYLAHRPDIDYSACRWTSSRTRPPRPAPSRRRSVTRSSCAPRSPAGAGRAGRSNRPIPYQL